VSLDRASSEIGDIRSCCIKGGEFLVHLTDLPASLPDGVNSVRKLNIRNPVVRTSVTY